MTDDPKARTYDSLSSAAASLGLEIEVLRKAKRAGCPAFKSNRVYAAELLPWLEANPQTVEVGMKDQKLIEEVRKLKLANDLKEGRLVPRVWVAERIQRAAGELNAYRLRSESEHPALFARACPGVDITQLRGLVRTIWTDIMQQFGKLGDHLDDGSPIAASEPVGIRKTRKAESVKKNKK